MSEAIKGGQLVAQGPLQTDLPLPAASRSNVYRVMPLGPTRAPSAVLAGLEDIIEAQPAIRLAAARARKSFFMIAPAVVGSYERMNTGACRLIPSHRQKKRSRQRLRLFMARSTSRLPSRSLMVLRLSCSALPFASAISHLTLPAFQCRLSGTRVYPFCSTLPTRRRISSLCISSFLLRTASGWTWVEAVFRALIWQQMRHNSPPLMTT